MSKQTTYILIGLPGSGKSTWAINHVNSETRVKTEPNLNGCVIISRDTIRHMLNGNYAYIEDQQELITEIAASAASAALKEGKDIMVDQLNINKEDRKEVTDFIIKHFESRDEVNIIFIHFTEEQNNVERRMRGDCRGEYGTYHQRVINKSKKKYEEVDESENYDVFMQIDGQGVVSHWRVNCNVEDTSISNSFSRKEIRNLSWSIAEFIYPRLKAFKEEICGYPSHLDYKNGKLRHSRRHGPLANRATPKLWEEIIDKMILAFELWLSCDDWKDEVNSKEYNKKWAKIDEGFGLFRKYFNGLWI
jgi:predicted kinase